MRGKFVKGLWFQVCSVKLARDRLNSSLPVLPVLPEQGQQVFYQNMTTSVAMTTRHFSTASTPGCWN